MQIGASDRIDMLCAAFLNKIVMFLCYADFVYDFTALKHAVMDCGAQAISQHRQIPFLDLPIRFTDLLAATHSLTRFVSFACLPHKERMICLLYTSSFYFSSMSYPTWKVALAIDHWTILDSKDINQPNCSSIKIRSYQHFSAFHSINYIGYFLAPPYFAYNSEIMLFIMDNIADIIKKLLWCSSFFVFMFHFTQLRNTLFVLL